MLYMKVPTQKQRYIPVFQKVHKLFTVFNRAFVYINLTFIQQVMMGNGDDLYTSIPGCLQLLPDPFISSEIAPPTLLTGLYWQLSIMSSQVFSSSSYR